MSSSGSGRENPSSSSSDDKSENPFIRFKQYTDAKVSSVLQGILGLPSAFSSNNNEPRTRWADLDDDLKRRDELKARQQALRDAESRKQYREEEQVGNALKDSSDFPPIPEDNSSNQHNAMDDEGELRHVEFYTPVTKSLFGHLSQSSEDNHVEWNNPLSTSPELAWDMLGKCWPWSGNIYKLHEYQIGPSPLSMVQAMTFNTLNRTAKRPECRWFHSDRSVLPYVLFSPYSPLALSIQPTAVPAPRPVHTSYSDTSGGMRWCDAFEDLLLASSGREMMPTKPLSTEDNEYDEGDFRQMGNDTLQKKQTAIRAMTWINGLQAQGLLERHVFLNRPSLTEVGLLLSLLSPLMAISASGVDEEVGSADSGNLPQTEEEVHDYFQSLASQTKQISDEARPPFADVMSLVGFFEKMANEAESVEQVVNQLEAFRDRKADPTSSDRSVQRSTRSPQAFSIEAFLRGHPPTQKSVATQTDIDREVTEASDDDDYSKDYQMQLGLIGQQRDVNTQTTRQEEGRIRGMRQEQPTSANDITDNTELKKNERTISTITTTEQTTSVDGTKMTTVSVTKYFADGRSVKTETFHSETPNYEDMRKSWKQNDDKVDDQEADAKLEKKSDGKNGNDKGKGKGWFWN